MIPCLSAQVRAPVILHTSFHLLRELEGAFFQVEVHLTFADLNPLWYPEGKT